MSDHKNDDQQDFEAMFQSSGPEQRDVDEVVEVIDVAEENPSPDVDDVSEDYTSSSSSSGGFTDIDDGIEDDDEGIFAASPSARKSEKKSSFGMLLFSAAALAIVGAGGYVYLKDPEMLSRIKSNFSGGGAENAVAIPSFELTEPPAPEATLTNSAEAPQESAPEDSAASAIDGDMPPQPEILSPDTAAPETSVAKAVAPQETQVPPQISEPPPVADSAVPPTIVDASAPSPVSASASVPEGAAPVAHEDGPPQGAEALEGEVKFIKPVEEKDSTLKLVDDVSSKAPEDKSLVSAEEPEVQGQEDNTTLQGDVTDGVKEAESVYFDSPSGKILSNLPAPSIDVKRGQGESLIIVNPPSSNKTSHKKSSSKSATTSSKMVAIETTTLDSRVVAAGRALKLGRHEAAQEMYDELYKLNPRDARILMGRAVLFQKLGEPGRAISTYEELLAVDPSNTEAIVNLAGLIRKDHPAVALSKL
ncbi:MAG TPA: tetratricopeptide repeat protein, partial [Alphaproteobacteria bacterium]|nr:tetratricopeptide repeat protein [Alphaproteobacteria bacterium]